MYSKLFGTINLVAVLVMSLQTLGTSATAMLWASDPGSYYEDYEELESSIPGSDVFEKAEEENEKTEEENCLSRVVLMDLAKNALSLCAYHCPDFEPSVNTIQYNIRPPLHQLHCVFVI